MLRPMRHKLFALVTLLAALPAGLAEAQPLIQSQEGIALENQILQLQSQVQQLQSTNGGGGSALGSVATPTPLSGPSTAVPAPSLVTSLLNQVNQLQSQVQQLSGRVDTLQNQVNTQHDATEKEIGDLAFKVNGGATPGAPTGAPSAATPSAPAQASAAPAPAPAFTGSPAQILHTGLTAYAKGDNATAQAAARDILANANTSPQAYRAQYLLAQALLAQGKAQNAAIAYDDAYNRSRTGLYAADSLLGLADSLADINQNGAACDTLASLNSQFPTPSPGLASRIAGVSQKAHCS